MNSQSKKSMHKVDHHEITEDYGSVWDYKSWERQKYNHKYRTQNISKTSQLQHKTSENHWTNSVYFNTCLVPDTFPHV